jgi:hypothetical protein
MSPESVKRFRDEDMRKIENLQRVRVNSFEFFSRGHAVGPTPQSVTAIRRARHFILPVNPTRKG